MRKGWEARKIGEIFETVTGNTPPKSNSRFYGADIPFIKPPELQDNFVDSAEDGLSFEGGRVARVLPENSVLISCIGNLGKIGINSVPVAFNQQINAIKPSKIALPKFIFYQVLSSFFKDQLFSMSSGTTVTIVNKNKFNSIVFTVPPLQEQRRIVAILDDAFDRIDKAIANTESNVLNATELFESYLNNVVLQQYDRHKTTKISDECGVTVGHVGSMASRYTTNGIPFLRSQNIKPFAVDLTDVKFIDDEFHASLQKSKLTAGDVAIVRTGYPGTAAVIPDDLEVSNCSDLVIIKPNKSLSPRYLVAFLNSRHGRVIVGLNLVGAAQKHFNVAAAKNVNIPLPPIEEQERIAGCVSINKQASDELVLQFRAKLASLHALKQSLLAAAFSGELTTDFNPEALEDDL